MKWKPANLSNTEFIAALLFKIILGLVYGYIYLHFYGGDDTWKYHYNSIAETRLLLSDPLTFFINEYTPVHAWHDAGSWREVATLYLNDLQYALFTKSFSILNLVTQGNYYLNVAIFDLLVFLGHYKLFDWLSKMYPEKRKWLFFGCFFYAPAVFWLSGLRIDGLLFLFVSLFIYEVQKHKPSVPVLAVYFAAIVIARPEVAMLLVPAFLSYQLCRAGWSPGKAFRVIYILSFILFFSSKWWLPGGGLPAFFAEKQHLFLQLNGTRFRLDALDVSAVSYLKVFPQAFANTFLRPALWEARGTLQWLAACEIIVFWLFFLYAVIKRHPGWKQRLGHPVILFVLVFSISIYLSTGYLVPFPGAIIRYKAIALLFLINVGIILTRHGGIKENHNVSFRSSKP